MPGKQIKFPLNKPEIYSQQTKALEAHGLIQFLHVYISKNINSHERDGDVLITRRNMKCTFSTEVANSV